MRDPHASEISDLDSVDDADVSLREKVTLLKRKVNKLEDLVTKLTDRNKELKERLLEAREQTKRARIDLRTVNVIRHNSADGMDEFFAKNSEDEPYQRFAEAVLKLFQSENLSLNGLSVIDAGVGPGSMLCHLVAHYQPKSIAGFDFSPVAIEQAKARIPNGTFTVASIYDLPASKFDAVLCTETLEHLEYPRQALHNLLQIIDDKGFAFLTVPDGRIDYSGLHINFWSPESWRVFIQESCGTSYSAQFGAIKAQERALYANNYAVIRKK